MSQIFRTRIAVMLSLLLVLPSVLGLLPMAELQSEAASGSQLWWYMYSDTVEIEEGQKFFVGDYAYTYAPTKFTASMLKVSYKSSNISVATVNSKGYMETLAPGETTITLKYKGKSYTKNFRVVAAGTFGDEDYVTELSQLAADMSTLPKSITTKNGFKYVNSYKKFQEKADELEDKISSTGFLKTEVVIGNTTYQSNTNQLAVPQAGRTETLSILLQKYGSKNNPTSTRTAKMLKYSSAKANVKKNTITITLKKKVTKQQILGAKTSDLYGYGMNSSKQSNKQAYVSVSVLHKGKYYDGWALIKEGSKKATLKLYQGKYVNGKYVRKNVKIKKGQTYQLGMKNSSWPLGKKVKAK